MMNKSKQLLFLLATILSFTFGVTALSTWADDNEVDAVEGPYRTMFRQEVDELGGHEKGKMLRINSTEALQAGLNKLSAEGWELVAVEGGRRVALTGPNNPMASYPPIYIFKRTSE